MPAFQELNLLLPADKILRMLTYHFSRYLLSEHVLVDGETIETVRDFIFGGSKITVDGDDCSHEIKKRLLLERNAMISLLLLLLSHFSRVRLCATPQTVAHQAPLSLGFSRQEHWSGLPFPSPMHESEK